MREILVVDCETRESFWRTLKSDSRVLFASTAKRGLAMLSDDIDIVFLGTELTDMNSKEALRLIRERHHSVAVIPVASKGKEEICGEISGGGKENYIRKPCEAQEIPGSADMFRGLKVMARGDWRKHYPDIPLHIVDGVLRVSDFIAHNPSESITLAAACKMAATSKTYFCRFFKNITGYSLRNYHHAVKIRTAEKFLRDKRLSVKDIARKLGYCDPNYFSTIYKKFKGVSPGKRQAYYQP